MKVDYILRETLANLRRNITLTIAAVVTVAVSLALFGSTILLTQGVDNVSTRWKDGIEVIAFLKSDVTDEQRDAIEAAILDNPEVEAVEHYDLEESREEALRIFERHELMYQKVESGDTAVPESFRLKPRSSDVNLMESMGEQLQAQPGVLNVRDVSDSVKIVTGVSRFLRQAMLIIGIGLLVAALLLILNTIRMAMFARRREIEVMKLVGATNWFIRVPFMLEGVVQGMVGALLALGVVVGLDYFMEVASENDDYQALLSGFVATSSELFWTGFVVLALGIVIGAAGSGWAISRFLRV